MKYFISCGEVSGETHASYIVQEMKKKNKSIEVYGVGGEKLRKNGVNIVEDIENIAVMGVLEVLGKIRYLREKAKEYIKIIKKENIKNVILVDYGGFNIYFLKKIKKEIKDVKVFYYIPPKLWAWGKNRINSLKLADYILVIFPWEVDFYKKYKVDAIYYGNPLVDVIPKREKKGDAILLLPGSRLNEIKNILPIFIEVVKEKKEKKFIIKPATLKQKKLIERYIQNLPNIKIVSEDEKLEKIVNLCEFAIAASGTVTLELALLHVPTIVCYKFSLLTEIIAKLFLKIKYVSLPNLILNKEVYKELLQSKFNEENLLREMENIEKVSLENDFKKIREELGGEEVITKYAEIILRESNYE